MAERTHKDWLEFLRKAAELPIGYSVDDLIWFRTIAERQYPALAPLVDACIHLAQESGLAIAFEGPAPRPTKARRAPQTRTPLFDLFKDRRLFPKNSDLATFALRAIPDMKEYRFDKMSRGDIALRLTEHIEKLGPKARDALETSMRNALSHPPEADDGSRSFVSKWTNIIKEMPL